MSKKFAIGIIVSLLLTFTTMFAPVSEAVAAPAEKIIIFNHGREPKAWDPSIDDSDGSTVIGNIFDGLMRDKKDGTLTYGQAKSYTVSKDGLTYTFKLRDDIFWTDGKPVTAKDFAYGWMRLIDPKAGAGYAYMGTSYIKNAKAYFDGKVKADKVGIKAIDNKTFEVKLETPTPFFLNLTTFFAFMPVRKDIVEKYGDGWEKNPKTCISNGPFYLADYKLGEYMMLAKNKKFYDKNLVKSDKIKFEFITEQTTALNAFMNGDLYVNQEIPPAEVSKLIAEEPDLVFAPRLQTTYIIFNVDKAPFNDARVRKAFSLALNRKALCESALKGGETPATGLIPPVLSFSDGTSCRKLDAKKRPAPEFGIDPNAARVKEAQKLLAEAGYPNGKGLPKITYSYVTKESLKKLSEAIQEMWKNNLNVKVELENMEWQVLVEKRKNGNFLVSGGNWIGDYVDPMTFFDAFAADSSWNEAQWRWRKSAVAPHDKTLNASHKKFESEINLAQRTNGKTRDGHLKAAEKILMDDMVVAPIFYGNYCYLVNQSKVKDVWRNKIGEWKFWDASLIK